MFPSEKPEARRWIRAVIGFLAAVLFCLAGCDREKMPECQGVFSNLSEAMAAYRDYLKLERRGAEMLYIDMGSGQITATLPYYLFVLGREFERLDQPQAAVKLYIRLQMHYTLLNDEHPLALRTENRIHWILGDKRWFQPTAGSLTASLRRALQNKNLHDLEAVMSRDFGFGEEADGEERIPLDYREAAQMIASQWLGKKAISLSLVSREANTVYLKATGWSGEHKVWNLVLHRRDRPRGWEWDTVTWGD
jgi:hypothetical protein